MSETLKRYVAGPSWRVKPGVRLVYRLDIRGECPGGAICSRHATKDFFEVNTFGKPWGALYVPWNTVGEHEGMGTAIGAPAITRWGQHR